MSDITGFTGDDVVIDGVIDTSNDPQAARGTILLGDGGAYGENLPDSMHSITLSNVICNSQKAVFVQGYLTESVMMNIVNKNPDCEAVAVARENGLKNTVISNAVTKK